MEPLERQRRPARAADATITDLDPQFISMAIEEAACRSRSVACVLAAVDRGTHQADIDLVHSLAGLAASAAVWGARALEYIEAA